MDALNAVSTRHVDVIDAELSAWAWRVRCKGDLLLFRRVARPCQAVDMHEMQAMLGLNSNGNSEQT